MQRRQRIYHFWLNEVHLLKTLCPACTGQALLAAPRTPPSCTSLPNQHDAEGSLRGSLSPTPSPHVLRAPPGVQSLKKFSSFFRRGAPCGTGTNSESSMAMLPGKEGEGWRSQAMQNLAKQLGMDPMSPEDSEESHRQVPCEELACCHVCTGEQSKRLDSAAYVMLGVRRSKNWTVCATISRAFWIGGYRAL